MSLNKGDEVLLAIPEEDRAIAALAANRFTNMVGGRWSDACRSEVDRYQRMGRDAYLAEEKRGREWFRANGY